MKKFLARIQNLARIMQDSCNILNFFITRVNFLVTKITLVYKNRFISAIMDKDGLRVEEKHEKLYLSLFEFYKFISVKQRLGLGQ